MQVQPITDNSFGAKNTFWQIAKDSVNVEDKNYFKSLHYEAKARLHYAKFKDASKELAEIKTMNFKNAVKLVKSIYTVTKEKLISISNQTESFHSYPERFYTADNEMLFPHRFYKRGKL